MARRDERRRSGRDPHGACPAPTGAIAVPRPSHVGGIASIAPDRSLRGTSRRTAATRHRTPPRTEPSSRPQSAAPPESPLYAAIDVGSHSAKLLVAGRDPDAGWRTVCERVVVTRLAAGGARDLHLTPAGRGRTLAALADFMDLVRSLGAVAVAAVGTMALRRAREAGSFLAEARRTVALDLDVISGVEEARLTYLGAVAGLRGREQGGALLLAADIGGASTELAWGRGGRPDDGLSLSIGTITLTAAHGLDGAVDARVAAAAAADVAAALAEVGPPRAPRSVLAIGATPASLLALDLGRDVADGPLADGRELTRPVIEAQIDRLRGLPAAARRLLPGLHPDRAEVILAGALIMGAIGRRWPRAALRVSVGGLRLGLLEDRFGGGA